MIWSPQRYWWPENYQAAACFSTDVDANAPFQWANRQRLPEILAEPEHRLYGMRKGLSRIVDMLDRIDLKGSFFVPGVVAEQNPELLPGLVSRGHEIALHGFHHELVSEISASEFTEALENSIELFLTQTGQRPGGFRSPA